MPAPRSRVDPPEAQALTSPRCERLRSAGPATGRVSESGSSTKLGLLELSKPSAPRRSNVTPVTGPVRVAGLDFVLRSESLLSETRKGRTANTPSPPTDAPPRHSLYQFSPKTTQEHYPTGKTGWLRAEGGYLALRQLVFPPPTIQLWRTSSAFGKLLRSFL